jgi:hypothetical protein
MTNWIRAAAVLLALCCVPAQANNAKTATDTDHFDKAGTKVRYEDWYARFEADIRALAKELHTGRKPDQARMNEIFADSLVPDSRMILFLGNLVKKDPDAFGIGRTDPPVRGWANVMMFLLRGSVPAGQGGLFKASKMIPSDKGSFVWYLTMPADSSISEVLKDPKIFTPYHLPPAGVLERHAYPFVIFREEHGKLYLTSISKEFAQVVIALYQMQLY